MVDLWKNGSFHIQNHRTVRSVVAYGKRPQKFLRHIPVFPAAVSQSRSFSLNGRMD